MSTFNRPERNRTASFMRPVGSGTSKNDLERDSGFSDASSEYLSTVDQTDFEDTGRKEPVVGQEASGLQVALMGGSYPGLSPMIIMNNFVVKQQSQMASEEKHFGFSSPLDVIPPSQVVLLQPMLSNSSSSPSRTGSENSRQSKCYKPTLKSYPRIAPHPEETFTKRPVAPRMRERSSSEYAPRQRRHAYSLKLSSSQSPQPAQPIARPGTPAFKVANYPQAQAAESQKSVSPMPESEFWTVVNCNNEYPYNYQDCLSPDSHKFKRFSNTYNILNKCGLLGITMRTKQLIKENKRTQGQLQQLQEQTALLLEALDSGNPHLWTKLQLSLQDTDK